MTKRDWFWWWLACAICVPREVLARWVAGDACTKLAAAEGAERRRDWRAGAWRRLWEPKGPSGGVSAEALP